MTQNTPSERALSALKASGMGQSPLMSLEREDALFVLTDDMLVYQDGGGTRRVTLRDLTRIHSDQAGLLRVETPAGTALTASLLGFDVGQVQSFFKGVRSATARAKDLPASDLPASSTPMPGAAKTFGSAPAHGAATTGATGAKSNTSQSGTPQKESTVQQEGAAAAGPAEQEKPAVQTPAPDAAVSRSAEPPPAPTPEPDEPASDGQTEEAKASTAPQTPAPSSSPAASQAGVPAQPQGASEDSAGKGAAAAASGPGSSPSSAATDAAARPVPKTPATGPTDSKPAEARKSEGHAENPVVISSSSFSPTVSKPGLGAAGADSGALGKVNPLPARTGTPGLEKSSLEKSGLEKSGTQKFSAALKLPRPELGKGSAPRPEAPSLHLPKTDGATATADPTAARIELPHRPTPRSPVSVPGAAGPAEGQDASALPQLPAADLTPTVSAPAAPPTTALSRVAAATALARQAETVDALAGRLRILGAVLFVGALALAYFQFTGNQALAGIWTLLSGGVGAIALLALGELSGLLSLLARAKND